MFTGLVEHLGLVSAIAPLDASASGGGGFSITISDSAPILADCHVGDSICVNGACLTVTEFGPDWFKVGLAPETLERTDLGERRVGDRVNLERAMAAHVRFGGHFVQGHVDDTATILTRVPDANSLRLTLQLSDPTPTRPSLLPYLITKGYVTLDGASLTLTHVDDAKRTFGVMLIAHTREKITLADKPVGARVNVEVDMVGKYVERAVLSALGGEGGEPGEGIIALLERMVQKAVAEATKK
ncbi:Riboflavin synthase alpha chain [Ceratobasidium sp. 370]|nr:Riboflavin synthase alpha chain [Ceratobasidium sp. 370]